VPLLVLTTVAAKEGKAFFSEEKNQKTFSDAVPDLADSTVT
jgi:hypothetical protein